MPLETKKKLNTSQRSDFYRRIIPLIAVLMGIGHFSLSLKAQSLNPFEIKKEFEDKLTAQSILQSTKYYARGLTFTQGQIFNLEKFQSEMNQRSYRLRLAEQALLKGDYGPLDIQTCSNITQLELKTTSQCWQWINQDEQFQLLIVDGGLVTQTFAGAPLASQHAVSTDAVLVAQFRNNEPLMQNEIKLSEYPIACLNAVIAIEDNDFLQHSGISYMGLARAFIKNVISMRKAQGGSTITQQLIKNYFLTPEKTLTRKAKELYMATQLESRWNKDQILETYLNVIYMGQNGAFQVRGFGAASSYYFNKPVQNLDLSECALLAAIINNPGMNHPWKKAEKATGRRKLVLTKMKDLKLITEDQFITADKKILPIEKKQQASETAPYYFDAAKKQAQDMGFKIEGASIFTTLDLNAQDAAQKALQKGIEDLSKTKKNISSQKEKGIDLQGVILTAENSTGYVTTFVGGQNFRKSQFNRALYSQRQVGSLIKPFVYLTGLIEGIDGQKVTATTSIPDQSFEWKMDKTKWRPENYDKKFRGDVPYFYALKESLNVPTAWITQKVGLDRFIETCQAFGLTSKIEKFPSSSLGASQHTPLEILQSYLNIARFGEMQTVSFIEAIRNNENELIYQHQIKTEQKIDRVKASLLVGMMKETFQSGTAKSAKLFGFKQIAAGKTGTTSDGKDAWFAGFTKDQTSVVWLGFDQSLATSLTGAGGAVPIWAQYMKVLTANDTEVDFDWPKETEKRTVDETIESTKAELVFEKSTF